ncbi:MAG: chemotaxis protein CheW [Gammaproteobacteria bacterium]|nr:chemotaxis protein CheW [Gammaproteobacteria bacterium]
MNTTVDLATLVDQPFAVLQEMERRSRAAHTGQSADVSAEWVGVAFRIGEEQFVADRNQVREVLMLPEDVTRVPGAKRWLLGIANLRGHLLPLIDVKLLLGSGRTSLRRGARVISVNHREVPAGIVVDEVMGFRRFMDHEYSDEAVNTIVRCENFLAGSYRRGEERWPVFNLFDLVESKMFLQAAAE